MSVRLLTTEQLLALGAERGTARAVIQSASGRQLLVVQAGRAQFFVMDNLCHHMGASLVDGELVDIEDEAHLVCPAHGRHICLSTGELVESALDPHSGRCHAVRRRVVQRMHPCEIQHDGLWVRVSNPADDGVAIESDQYNLVPRAGREPAGRAAGQIGFQARKQRATLAVAAKLEPQRAALAVPSLAPAARSEAILPEAEEDALELTPPQPPQFAPAKQLPQAVKRTINDYWGPVAAKQQAQPQPQRGLTADDPMDVG